MESNLHHHPGEVVEIVGLTRPENGRSCEEHEVCGKVAKPDIVVRFRKVQVVRDGKEESAIAVEWVTDGIDRCRIGFLPRHMVKHWKKYEGQLAQITELYAGNDSPTKRRKDYSNEGCCSAVIISSVMPALNLDADQKKDNDPNKKRKATTTK